MNFAPAMFGVSAQASGPLFILAHAVSTLLISMFASALVVTSYGLLIRYVDKERFNNLIAYAQAALAMFFIVGFQLLPRILERYEDNLSLIDRRYFLFFPPAWFTGISMLIMGKFSKLNMAMALLACLSLLILCTLALRKIAGGYASFVTQLAHDS